MHTFSTIAMPDRKKKTLMYYLVYSYRIKGISFPTRNEEKKTKTKLLKNPQIFSAIRVLVKFFSSWWMILYELCIRTSSPRSRVNFCTCPESPSCFPVGLCHFRQERWRWRWGSELPRVDTTGQRRGLCWSHRQRAKGIGQELGIHWKCVCVTQRGEFLPFFHVCHRHVDEK